MSPKKKMRGVVERVVLLAACRAGPDLLVQQLHGIQIVGDFVAHGRMVGIVGRQHDLGGIDQRLLPARRHERRPLVRRREVDLRVKGLARLALVPVRSVERVRGGEIEIGFAVARHTLGDLAHVAGKVALLAEAVGDQLRALRQRVPVLAMAAMMLRPGGGLVEPDVERRAAGGADRRRRMELREARALVRQAVDDWECGLHDRRSSPIRTLGRRRESR